MGERSVAKFTKRLLQYPILAIDSSLFIYHIEENKKYVPFTEAIFEKLLPQGALSAIGATLLLTEVLTRPMEDSRQDLVLAYKSFIAGFPNFTLVPFDTEIAEKASYFRAQYDFRTPDAIHLATAFAGGAGAIIGNDKKWEKVKEIDVITLDEFILRA